jgi:hypothetical protein
MSRILVCGDIHGDIWNVKEIFRLAIKGNCSRIHCVGDFGYFPNLEECLEFLRYVSFAGIDSGIHFSFTDGNHENHHFLRDLFESRKSESIFVLPGIEWFWRGKYFENCLSIGGAYSIDKEYRTLGVDWFENEMISYSDFNRCSSEAEIIFSHDCPLGVDLGFPVNHFSTISNRKMLLEICKVVKPKILIHGHYHKHYWHDLKMEYGNLRVIGLDCNDGEISDQCLVLEENRVFWYEEIFS